MEEAGSAMQRLYLICGALFLLLTAGCCSDSGQRYESGERFTHINVEGPAPFVFFDQKTKQVCWGGSESSSGSVTVTVKIREDFTTVTMPACKSFN